MSPMSDFSCTSYERFHIDLRSQFRFCQGKLFVSHSSINRETKQRIITIVFNFLVFGFTSEIFSTYLVKEDENSRYCVVCDWSAVNDPCK